MQKILFIVVCTVALASGLSAQLQLENVDWQVTGSVEVVTDNEIEASWDVVNTGSEAVRVRVSREVISHPEPFNLPFSQAGEGARERFCWGPLCYNFGTALSADSESLLVTIEPGQSNDTFKGQYQHMGVQGAAHIRYCFFDVDNPDNQVCQDVLYCVDAAVCALNVEVAKQPELSNMGPNPVLGRSAFTYDLGNTTGKREVIIYNMVGSEVKRILLNNPLGTVFITADDFDAGIYFYALLVNGTPVTTKKFVVSK